MPNWVPYEALSAHRSCGLAWLGPILYPLTFAVLAQAQAVVWRRVLRSYCGGKTQRHAGDNSPARADVDRLVDIVVGAIMSAETIFGLCCLVQCVINFSARRFVGGAAACDVQALYASYYVIASLLLCPFGVVAGWRIVCTDGACPLLRPPILVGAAVAIHLTALLVAALPLAGVGSYMFATDYCIFNQETAAYSAVVLTLLVVGGGLSLFASARLWRSARPTLTSTAPLAGLPTTTTEESDSESARALEKQPRPQPRQPLMPTEALGTCTCDGGGWNSSGPS